MKICILNPSYEDSKSPTKEHDPACDPAFYLPGHDCGHVCEAHWIKKGTAAEQVAGLARQGFDVFINLCDGASDEDRAGLEVVLALERLGVSFTGAAASFYEPTRLQMKQVCAEWGLKTPAFVFAKDASGIRQATHVLRFPLIVKPPNGYGSVGLTRDSRVETREQLWLQSRQTIKNFGAALIEEFIEGREFTVLVAENPEDSLNPVAFRPVEFCFPPGENFKHFDLKWIHSDRMACEPCRDPQLDAQLREISKKLFVGLGGNSYARCDVRMDGAGELYLLEINPNCGVFYRPEAAGSADIILLNDPAGHQGFLELILEAAVKNVSQRRKDAKGGLDVC